MRELAWVAPAAIALAAAVVVLAVIATVRVLRRSPRARAAADRAVSDAAVALLALDDAVRELDVASEAADAIESTDVPLDLRRARSMAHRARDRGFDDLLTLEADAGVAARRRDQALRVHRALDEQRDRVGQARTRLSEWVDTHRTPEELLAAARRRRDDLVATAGDSRPLIAALRARFDETDWADAAAASADADRALAEVDAALARAATDPAGGHVQDATAALHRAARHLRGVEDDHRIALQAADNAEGEVAAAQAEMDEAIQVATSRPAACRPGAVERLREARAELDDAAASGSRRPREAVATVARVREHRDDLLGEAVSVRRRLEAARAALPGTLACARAAFAAAEMRDDGLDLNPAREGTEVENRERLSRRMDLKRARRRLAEARAATDAARALAAAREAWAALR